MPDGINEVTKELRMFIGQLEKAGLMPVHRNDDSGVCFDLVAPSGITDTKKWAEENARRMQSDTYNAVVAPEC